MLSEWWLRIGSTGDRTRITLQHNAKSDFSPSLLD